MKELYQNKQSKYCYENSNTLINKLNIKDTKELIKFEAKITAVKLLSLRQQGITGNFDKTHYINIHKFLFEDIYPFAGEFRTENISKGVFRFAQMEYIEQELDRLLGNLEKENYLINMPKRELAIKLAYYWSEINVLHPFREGNGRTNREFIRQLALKNGYRLNLKKVKPKQTLEASIKSIVYTEELENILELCLEEM